MKRIWLIAVCVVVVAMPLLAEETPSLSIGSVVSGVSSVSVGRRDNSQVAVREELVTELLEMYDCRVLTRSRGYDVALEHSVDSISSIDAARFETDQIPVADHLIMVSYREAQAGVAITGAVYCADLSVSGTSNASGRANFLANSVFDIAESAAKAIAGVLSLEQREHVPGKDSVGRNLVWAILPVDDHAWGAKSSFGKDFAEQLELRLTDEGDVQHLVERAVIDKLIKEQSLNSFSGMSGASATKLGKMVKADLLLVGQISPWKNSSLRLDLHLIETKNGSIVAASKLENVARNGMLDSAVKSVKEICRKQASPPALKASSRNQRKKEAEFLLSYDYYPQTPYTMGIMIKTRWATMVSTTEGAYILMRDDPDYVYKIMSELCRKMRALSTGLLRAEYQNLPATTRGCRLIYKALANMEPSGKRRLAPEMQAEALMHIGEYEKADKMFKDYLREHPGQDARLVYVNLAQCSYRQGKHEEALAYINKTDGRSASGIMTRWLKSQIEWELQKKNLSHSTGDSEKEEYKTYKAIFEPDKRKRGSAGGRIFEQHDRLSRFLELMRMIETPKFCLKEAERLFENPDYDFWGTPIMMYPVMVHKALSHYKAGNKVEASRIAQLVVESAMRPLPFSYAEYDEAAKASFDIIKNVKRDVGLVKPTWKCLADVKPIPKSYRIYVVPVGDVHDDIVHVAYYKMQEYFGECVAVLPALPLPFEVDTQEGLNIRKKEFYDGVVKSSSIPDDALFVAYVTKELLRYPVKLPDADEYVSRPYLMSYHDRWGGDSKVRIKTTARNVSWRIIVFFKYAGIEAYRNTDKSSRHQLKPCYNFPCPYSGRFTSMFSEQGRIEKICLECQDEIKSISYRKMHNSLISELEKMGAKILDPSTAEFITVPEEAQEWEAMYCEDPVSGDFLYTAYREKGLTATYFSGMNFETQVLTRIDKNIDFEWEAGAPDKAVGANNFSVRWTGKLKPAITGKYNLGTQSDDGVRLWLDGEKLIDNWTDHGETFDGSKVVQLEAGQEYDIKLEYYENDGGATIKLYWRREKK